MRGAYAAHKLDDNYLNYSVPNMDETDITWHECRMIIITLLTESVKLKQLISLVLHIQSIYEAIPEVRISNLVC